MSKPKISQVEVLKWLHEKFPKLHEVSEVERNWVWLAADLRGDVETRSAIKEYGFRWAKHGHTLPSGRIGTWAHACEHPIRGKSKGGGKVKKQEDKDEVSDDDLLAMIQSRK